MRYLYEFQDETHEIRLEAQPDGTLNAIIGDATYRVHAAPLNDGAYLLTVDGERHIVHVASAGDERYVQRAGVQTTLERSSGRRRRSAGAGAAGDLKAEMPGQVMDVRVGVGDAVSNGQVMVVLEAMKMEIRVTAPYDGTVAALLVAVGDVVERGQVLVEVTADD